MTTPTLSLTAALELAIKNLECIARITRKEGKWEPVAPSYLEKDVSDIKAALAAQPELPEPAGRMAWWEARPKVEWVGRPPETGELLYTAAQLQQAVEQAQPKREPMPEEKLFELIHKHLGYRPHPHRHEHVIDSLKGRFHDKQRYRDLLSDIEAHHGIGDKA